MIIGDRPEILARGSKTRPLLVVLQNLGAGGSPNLLIGKQPGQLRPTSGQGRALVIAPATVSPQITITETWYIISGTVGTAQNYDVQVDNL
jgi:hypothetical protein